MKLVILNDTHAGLRNGSDIFADNAEKFYSELFFPFCKENNITQILHLGDYFDNRKVIPVKTLFRNRKMFLEPMQKAGMHMDIICGNHDVTFKNTNDINSLKEALGYYKDEITIHMDPTVVKYGSLSIALIPWMNASNTESTLKFINKCRAPMVAGHFEFNGFDLMQGVKSIHGLDHKLFKKFELVMSGHYHTRSMIDNILYLGSQMEFTWADAHDTKFMYVLDTETRELETIENPFTLYEKVVYNDEDIDYNNYDTSKLDNKFVKVIVKKKADLFMFDKFIDRIQNQNILDLKIAETFAAFTGSEVEDEGLQLEDTEVLIASYIDAVNTELDKERLKVKMRELYEHALSLSIE